MSGLVGQRFGRLVVTAEWVEKKHRWCIADCDCGAEKRVRASSLRAGFTKSCGCWASDRMASMNHRHGETVASKPTPEWRTWRSMRQRCEDPSQSSYERYGGRGISVCCGDGRRPMSARKLAKPFSPRNRRPRRRLPDGRFEARGRSA